MGISPNFYIIFYQLRQLKPLQSLFRAIVHFALPAQNPVPNHLFGGIENGQMFLQTRKGLLNRINQSANGISNRESRVYKELKLVNFKKT
jgi:hypothetical protein